MSHGRASVAISLLGLVAGCEPGPSSPHYTVLRGVVLSCHPETGDLSIHPTGTSSRWPADAQAPCIVTKASEVYINDRFSSMAEIRLGAEVELVGYRDANPPLERFVVTYAYVDQPEPPAPEPLRAPTTQSTSQPGG